MLSQLESATVPCRLIVFGDQSSSSLSNSARQLLYSQKREKPNLRYFIDSVNTALRSDVAKLHISDRRWLPQFSTVEELAQRASQSNENAVTDAVLATFHHLCSFISFFDHSSVHFPTAAENYHVTGLCAGSLAAAVISSSASLADVVSMGVTAVRLALLVGVQAARARSLLTTGMSQPSATSTTWSYIFPDTVLPYEQAQSMISAYIQHKSIPGLSIPYISAYGYKSLTISGPPESLQGFMSYCLSTKSCEPHGKPTALDIHAPYHAPHIFSEEDISTLFSNLGEVQDAHSKLSFLSSSSGQVVTRSTFEEQLRLAVQSMLRLPLQVSDLAVNVANTCTSMDPTASCIIMPIMASIPSGFVSEIQSISARLCTLDHSIMKEQSARSANTPATQPISGSKRPEESKIAIVGMSGRFPEAADVDQFWDLLHKGLDVHRRIPKDRFNADLYYDETGKRKNTSKVKHGCWINEPGLFDPAFFNISPKEAEQSDPAQRLALETAYEAIEMAGIVPGRTPSTQRDRVGVFYGTTSDDWREVNSGQNVDTYFIPGGNRAFTPGKVNYFFKFSGPSVSVDTACSSSLAAIHTACNALWRNDCDTAVAGGTNVMTNPDSFAGLDRGHFLSRKGNCNTFDDEADGYCRADAVGTVILKRMEDAIADNDPILGVIVGAYTNHSAESVSITRPHCAAQEFIFNKLLNEHAVNPHSISYVEMHGTGTQAGDATEMASVLNTFAPDHHRTSNEELYLGSAKANVGHSESASGVTSLIKVLLMMKKNTIPPHCGIKTKINHKFPTDLEARNVHIAKRPVPWNRPSGPDNLRRVFVNNFSAAGGNTALLVEDAPGARGLLSETVDPRSAHIVTSSAKSAAALKRNLANLATFVSQEQYNQNSSLLAKLSYTTTARRMHHPFRVAIAATNIQELSQILQSKSELAPENFKRVSAATKKVNFVFSGQGAQYSAMGRQLFDSFTPFRNDILAYDALGRAHGFPSVIPLIDGSIEVHNLEPLVVQLGTVCLQMALANMWKSVGIEPTFVIGHSLGHFAALHVAGVLTASDTIYLVGRRAQLLQEKCKQGTHGMLAVRASVADIEPYLDQHLHDVACINSPEDTVISAEAENIEVLAQRLTDAGFKSTKIKVPFAFHSAQTDAILEDLEDVASHVIFHTPSVSIGCSLLGTVVEAGQSGELNASCIKRHCRETVNFAKCLDDAAGKGFCDSGVWIELGPHDVCSSMVKANLGHDTCVMPSLRRKADNWMVLANDVGILYNLGFSINWDEYHRCFDQCKEVLPLPAYSWDNKTYWIQYVYDWMLTKGSPTSSPQALLPQAPPTVSTPSVQRVIEDTQTGTTVKLVIESDYGHHLLNGISQGHLVNGSRLCTSSLYADIGLTLGRHLLKQYHVNLTDHSVNVKSMTVHKPLILKEGTSQAPFRTQVLHDIPSKTAQMSIYSVDAQGRKTTLHAECILVLEDTHDWPLEWDRSKYYIERSVGWLKERASQGLNSKLSAGVVYKLFASLVDYSQGFKGIQEAIVSSEDFEATAKVQFQADQDGFICNPMWLDSCGQLAGFVMNGHESTPSDQVFINHGWQSLRLLLDKFDRNATYRTYVRMRLISGTTYAGDVYIFDEDNNVIGICGGSTFQGIPRRVLNVALPSVGPAKNPPVPSSTSPLQATIQSDAKRQHSAKPTVLAPPETAKVRSNVDSSLQSALIILSEEIGLGLEAFDDDDLSFADSGVDSLLSLTIVGRFREELDIELDSSIFDTCPTIGDFKTFMGGSTSNSSSSSSTPSHSESETDASEACSSEVGTPCIESKGHLGSSSVLDGVCTILAEEIGISVEEIRKDANLTDLGMDSLMTLTVLGRLLEEHDLKLDSDFFSIHQSFNSFKTVFQPSAAPAVTMEAQSLDLPADLTQWKATSILLQGSPRTARETLFLLPDGSGSSTSYQSISSIRPDVCVIGLNCPWLKTPERLSHFGIRGLVALYIKEIRRRLPNGPYSLGGWSAGGICAYEAAIQLTRLGQRVERLIFIDTPDPIGLEKLPPRMFDFVKSLGLFGSGEPPSWLLPHFLAFIDALYEWKPVPWQIAVGPQSELPRAHFIWAEDGVCNEPGGPKLEYTDDDPRDMRWLLENRTNFGTNNWDILLKGGDFSITRMSQANHFTMMQQGRNAAQVAAFIRGSFE